LALSLESGTIIWSFCPQVCLPNGILFHSTTFAVYTSVTDRCVHCAWAGWPMSWARPRDHLSECQGLAELIHSYIWRSKYSYFRVCPKGAFLSNKCLFSV